MTLARAFTALAGATSVALVAFGLPQANKPQAAAPGQAAPAQAAKAASTLYAVWLTPDPRPGDASDLVLRTNHEQYTAYLRSKGSILMDGPFADGSGYLWILKAANDEAAFRLVQEDPTVRSKYLDAVVKRWNGKEAPPISEKGSGSAAGG